MTVSLAEARRIRAQQAMDEDQRLEVRLTELADGIVASAEDMDYKQRDALVKIFKHYAKDPQPFRTCVKDNMDRFGPGKTEQFCATVKDAIRSIHHWRSDGLIASDDFQQGVGILLAMEDDALETLITEVTNAAA